MGLALVIFVPEGIVVASDNLEEIKNSDDGFLQKNQRRVFSYENKFLICIQSKDSAERLPWGYYVNKIWGSFNKRKFETTYEFASSLNEKLSTFLSDAKLICYVAGIDQSETDFFKFVVLMIDNNEIVPVNKGENGIEVYNYHAIGRSLWLNKIFLQTSFKQNEQTIKFDSVNIDFSKYSIDDAIDFGLTMIDVSRKLDEYTQLKQMIGENVCVGIVQPYMEIQIKEFHKTYIAER